MTLNGLGKNFVKSPHPTKICKPKVYKRIISISRIIYAWFHVISPQNLINPFSVTCICRRANFVGHAHSTPPILVAGPFKRNNAQSSHSYGWERDEIQVIIQCLKSKCLKSKRSFSRNTFEQFLNPWFEPKVKFWRLKIHYFNSWNWLD